MEKADISLIRFLRKDSRVGLAEISRKTKKPISTLFYKLKRHEKNIIKKYTVLLNYRELGIEARVHLVIQTDEQGFNQIQQELKEHPNVNSLYVLRERTVYAETLFRSQFDLEDFLSSLKGRYNIVKLQRISIVEDVKQESGLS